ncbi:inactive polyglycylase TTLL10 isoform X3 [Phacochoerus africanus]|uniref:inactive polyglycylase TTLL10 isoform X3 n=1 Tax=Phacochoerus africanus TaxID=41426 RepID=UPI001FDA2449|nr:inactive polyglycylase TTLL10 isoform X3 [Phacochoerus africanus]
MQGAGQHPAPGGVSLTVCPAQGPGPGPRATRRSRRGVGATSSQGCPCPGAPIPAACGHTHFAHCRALPPRTQVGKKRGKRSRMAGVRRSHAQVPGWARERSMGSRREEGLLHQLSQRGREADDLDEDDAATPQATLLEKHPLAGEKRPSNSGQGPFFYIGGTNGASIISSYCKSKGWQRIQDARREDYQLKWCEVKSRDTYCSFREGEQLLFQLPNNKLLTTKIGLLSTLRERARVVSKTSKPAPCPQARSRKDTTLALEEPVWTSPGNLGPQRVLKMEEFFPETYRLDIREEREAFFTLFDETQIWICKPTASNQGKGIFLLRSQEEAAALQAKTQRLEDDPVYRKMPFRAPQARIVQRYIQNPLLLDGKKFDVRSYLLIACAVPCMVFFGHGYARLTLSLYNAHSSDLGGHLTNQASAPHRRGLSLQPGTKSLLKNPAPGLGRPACSQHCLSPLATAGHLVKAERPAPWPPAQLPPGVDQARAGIGAEGQGSLRGPQWREPAGRGLCGRVSLGRAGGGPSGCGGLQRLLRGRCCGRVSAKQGRCRVSWGAESPRTPGSLGQGEGLCRRPPWGQGLQVLHCPPVHAEEEPPLRAVQGRHSVEHGAPQPLHQRQVLQDQGPPPRLGLHHLHGACTPARPQGRTPERAAGWGGLVLGTSCRGSHVRCGSWQLGGACSDSLLPLSQMRSFTQHTRRPVGVPVAQRKRIRRGTVRLRVGSLAPLRG